jgi:hypothetical protein
MGQLACSRAEINSATQSITPNNYITFNTKTPYGCQFFFSEPSPHTLNPPLAVVLLFLSLVSIQHKQRPTTTATTVPAAMARNDYGTT